MPGGTIQDDIQKAFASKRYLDAFEMLSGLGETEPSLAWKLLQTNKNEFINDIKIWERKVNSKDDLFLPFDLLEKDLDIAYADMVALIEDLAEIHEDEGGSSTLSVKFEPGRAQLVNQAVQRVEEERQVRRAMNWSTRSDLRGLETQLMDLGRRLLAQRGDSPSNMTYRQIASRMRRALANNPKMREYVRRLV